MAADGAELPRSHTIVWHIWLVLTGKLKEVWFRAAQPRPRCAAVLHTTFVLLNYSETLEEGEVYQKRLVSWPLFSGGTLRGVQKSGFNENGGGHVTWPGLL